MGAAGEILANQNKMLFTTSVQQNVFPFFTEIQQLSTLPFPIARGGLLNSIFRQIYQLIPFY